VAQVGHVALWTCDLERLAAFYATYFQAVPGPPYRNEAKGFASRFLKLGAGSRLELMQTTRLDLAAVEPGAQHLGLTHLALALGSVEAVNTLTRKLREDGHAVVEDPRWTGDGCYESVILDPDGNRIELTV